MKKKILTLSIALYAVLASAQISLIVNSTAGGLRDAIVAKDVYANAINDLTVTGHIDARDVKFIRDSMLSLSVLDLEASHIDDYKGNGGTVMGNISYPANEMPLYSFYYERPKACVDIDNKSVVKSGYIPNNKQTVSIITENSNAQIVYLSSIILPSSLTSIGDYAFADCYNLTGSLTIPDLVINIGDRAFFHCDGLTGSLTIPNSVTSIGTDAFLNCSGFTGNLIIPSSVTSIGVGAFCQCYKITSIRVDSNNPNFSDIDGVLFNKNKTNLIQCPAGKVSNSYSIPNSVKYIGNSAFSGCSVISGNLIIPNSVIDIGDFAFYICVGFKGSLNIGDSVTSIGKIAFFGCNFTGNLSIPNSVISIGNEAFYNCKGFTGLTIGHSVTSIGSSAFNGCSGFTGNLTIPDSVTLIQSWAFNGCSGFTGTLTIGNSVISIGWAAFQGCSGFESLTIPNSISSINGYAFHGCNNLSSILVAREVPVSIDTTVFEGINKNTCNLLVPKYSKAAYQAANEWRDFLNITELDVTGTVNIKVPSVSFVLSPNPCTNKVTIKGSKMQVATFYNINGSVVLYVNLQGTEETQMDVSELTSGVYFVKITTTDLKVHTLQFIKE